MYLNCHTYYSLRFGTFSEVTLLELAQKNNIDALVLTDINTTSACMNFVQQSKKFGIKAIVGVDFRNGALQQFVCIAKNNTGFYEINNYLSSYLETKSVIPDRCKTLHNTFVIYPFEKVLQLQINDLKENEFIGVSVEEVKKLKFSYLKKYCHKIVIQQQVTLRNQRDFNAHRLLRAIDNNTLLSKLNPSEQCLRTDVMHSKKDLENYFEEFPEVINNTKNILNACNIHFGFNVERSSQNQDVYLDSFESDLKMLKDLCDKMLYKRYPNPSEKVLQRLDKELKVIEELRFVSFFLINYDIVSYAKSQGFFHVGRGSGANSIVAYIIGITDVDPVELNLYFERFINPYRASPPDFDIDFSWKDRDLMTKYIFNRFKNVALLATYNTFKYRAVVREIGKVFGLPKEEIDKLSKGSSSSKFDEMSQLVLKYGKLIEGFPNYVSVHSAGILILKKPIHYYSATFLPPKGFITVQFDMYIADDVGIFKFDILGQRGLAKIKDALTIIKENQPNAPKIDIYDIDRFKNDENINNLLKTGGAIGAYYVESPAMRGLMQKLQTNTYLELVAASSIIRPGVSSSGMKDEYIKRHRNPEQRKNAHPILLKIMPETYGVMVYQEDVMRVAHEFAGLDLGEADVLRRGMSGKYRSKKEFEAVEKKFIKNCRAKGFDDYLITDVWNQIKSFAGYAFAKGHSASYAVESYQSLFLKCYYPIEFMCAVLNNGGGFYSAEHYIHEAKMQGAIIELPCINLSDHANCVHDKTIYLGFGYLKNLESLVIQHILSERQVNGLFTSLDDFINRVFISIEQLTILIRIGAFRFTRIPKKNLLWQATFRLKAQKPSNLKDQIDLFKLKQSSFTLPKLKNHWIEQVYDELELLDFTLYDLFDLVDEKYCKHILASEMQNHVNQNVLLYGKLVTTRFNKTAQGKLMRLSTFIDKKGHYFDAVHFTNVVHDYPISGMGIYACYGKITNRFGFCSMNVIKSKKLGILCDPRS